MDWTHSLSLGQDLDANARDSSGMTPLMSAVVRGHLGTARALLACEGLDVNARGHLGMTALMMAVLKGGVHGHSTHSDVRELPDMMSARGGKGSWKSGHSVGGCVNFY